MAYCETTRLGEEAMLFARELDAENAALFSLERLEYHHGKNPRVDPKGWKAPGCLRLI